MTLNRRNVLKAGAAAPLGGAALAQRQGAGGQHHQAGRARGYVRYVS